MTLNINSNYFYEIDIFFNHQCNALPSCSTIGQSDLCYNERFLEPGLFHYTFDGSYKGHPQQFEILKVNKHSDFQAKIVKVSSVLTKEELNQKYAFFDIEDIASRVSDIVAAINGGFFHYDVPFGYSYEWPDGNYKSGDAAGELIIEGKKISDNPKQKLWGAFQIDKQKNYSIKPSTEESSASIDYSLGSAPMLISNGRVIDLETEGENQAKLDLFQVAAPGQYSIHFPSRHPRTAICITKNEDLVFLAVKGRMWTAHGMNGKELQNLVQSLECQHALNLDGGGSTNMVTFDEQKNTLSIMNSERRPFSNIIALTRKTTHHKLFGFKNT